MIFFNRKIHLYLASPIIYPPRGGAELRFWRYLPGLRQRDINVTVVTGTPKAKKITADDCIQEWYQYNPGEIIPVDSVNGVPVHQVRLPDHTGWHRTIIFNQALLNFCFQSGQKPDIVQFLTPLPPRSIPWLIWLRIFGIARVFSYTLPSDLPVEFLKRSVHRWSLKRLYRQLDCLVASSEVTRNIVSGLVPESRLEVIPNGVDLERYRPGTIIERRQLRESLGLKNDDQVITTVCAVHPRKGVDLLLEAWGSLALKYPRAHLFIVGSRHDQVDPNLRSFSRRLKFLVDASGAGDRVHFTGSVKNVEEYLRISDVFAFASRKEGMGNVVLEAMATGLPVILTQFTGLPKAFGVPGSHYVLVEREADAFATEISTILDDSGLSAEMGESCRQLMEKTMGMGRILDRYAALYHELAYQSRMCRWHL